LKSELKDRNLNMDNYRDGRCHCLSCGIEMVNIAREGFQPMGGLALNSVGHYGSTEFDPMDGTRIEVVVCDPCLIKAEKYIYPYVGNVGPQDAISSESVDNSWKQYSGDFNAMTDEEIRTETEQANDLIDENESWVIAVALWEACGKPRDKL
jgi:hypothetical protein